MFRFTQVALIAALLAGCGGSHSPVGDARFVFRAKAGTYSDGAGSLGLTVVATLRDAAGNGPDVPWTLTASDLAGPVDVQASYAVSGPGSYVVWVFPGVAVSAGHTFSLQLSSPEGFTQGATVTVGSSELAPPAPALSADGSQLTWVVPPDAHRFACEVSASGEVQLSATGTTGACDVSALPPDSYTATIEAFSADPSQLQTDHSQTPELPEVDVSEGRLSFIRSDGSTPDLSLMLAGGRFDYGAGQPGLALWMALQQTDGGVTPVPWSVNVVGPGLPADAPLQLTYPANTPQTELWSYDVALAEGSYSFVASSDAGTLSGTFRVPAQTPLDPPTAAVATAQPNGGATVQWQGVPDAGSYFVGVWDHTTGTFSTGQWVTTTSTSFASQSFDAGTTYDVYVTATDADLTSPPQPRAETRASENTYSPASFTGI